MSDTPRTDEEVIAVFGANDTSLLVPADFARQIERENNRLSRMLEWFAENLQDVSVGGIDPTEYLLDEDDTWSMAWERALDDSIRALASAPSAPPADAP